VKWCLDNGITTQISTICTAQQISSGLKAALESNVISPMGTIDDSSFEILLAEDNHVNQRIALKFLEKYGHKVEIAENGAIAVDMYKQRCADHRSFDIVLVSRQLLPGWCELTAHYPDGCLYAHYGWYGSNRAYSQVRIFSKSRTNTYNCLDGPRE
jgi:hypothetical protein